jgi:O-antigen/teichoic acid export membrane protein
VYINYLPSQEAFGEVSLVFAWIVVFNVILAYGMETAFFRFYSNDDQPARTRGTALLSLLGSTILFSLIAFASLEGLESLTEIAARYWRWVVGILAADALAIIPFALMRSESQPVKYTWIKMLNVVFFAALTMVLLKAIPAGEGSPSWITGDKVERVFMANFGASLLTLLLVCRPYFRKMVWDPALWKKMLRYGFPILIAGLAFSVNETFDKVLLNWLLPLPETEAKAQVGIYTACYRLAIGMTLFATAFRLGVEPFFFSKATDKDAPETYALITKGFVIFGSIALLSYAVLLDLFKVILVPDASYWVAMDIVPLILFAYFFLGIYQSLSVWYKVSDRTSYGAIISVIAALLTIVLNVWLIPQIGYLASALATFSAYGLMLVLSYFMGRSRYPIPYETGKLVTYVVVTALLTSGYFYGLRPWLGINSWESYLAGFLLVGIFGLLIRFRESELIQTIINKGK